MELIKVSKGREIPLIKGMEVLLDAPHEVHSGPGDSRAIRVKFGNGRGASIVRFNGSYGYKEGKWELAILDKDGDLDYTTEISDDVMGHLSEEEILVILNKIAALPEESKELNITKSLT